MKRSALVWLGLTLVFALTASFGAVQMLRSYQETVEVVVARREILPFEAISYDMVQMVSRPRVAVSADVFRDVAQVVGRHARGLILAGSELRPGHLWEAAIPGNRTGLSVWLTGLGLPDHRAFAVPFDPNTAVGGQLARGDRVDLVAHVRVDQILLAKIIASNVQVVDVVSDQARGGSGTAILVVTPALAEDLTWVLQNGVLRLALNPFNADEAAAITPGVTGDSLLAKYGVRVLPPAAGQPVPRR